MQRVIKDHGRLEFVIFGALHGKFGQLGRRCFEVGAVEEGTCSWTSSRVNEEGLVDGISQQFVELVRRHKVTPLSAELGFRFAVEGISTCLHGHHRYAHRPDVNSRGIVRFGEAFWWKVQVLS